MCDLCRVNSNTHSFDSITEVSGVHVFYTSFQNLLDYSNFTNVRNHIEGELSRVPQLPWAWIIDCKYLESKHMFQLNFAVSIVKYLRRTHTQSLVNIYLLNGGLLMGSALKVLSPFIDKTFYSSIQMLHGTRLELLGQFQARGWMNRDLEPLMARLAREY
jgi:hypothetical protein